MISFKPQVGKAQTGQTSRGFAVIIPIYKLAKIRGKKKKKRDLNGVRCIKDEDQ